MIKKKIGFFLVILFCVSFIFGLYQYTQTSRLISGHQTHNSVQQNAFSENQGFFEGPSRIISQSGVKKSKLQGKKRDLLPPSEFIESDIINFLEGKKKIKKPFLKRLTKRFLLDSLLFYLAGNIVSSVVYGADSDIDPRFLQTELEAVQSVEGSLHFGAFIGFNILYQDMSDSILRGLDDSSKLKKLLSHRANAFMGMGFASVASSILVDTGSLLFYCSVQSLKKLKKTRKSEIFSSYEEHLSECDRLYYDFTTSKAPKRWANDLFLGLLPAAVLSSVVTGGTVKTYKWAKETLGKFSQGKQSNFKKLKGFISKNPSAKKFVASQKLRNIYMMLFNFTLFVGADKIVMDPVRRWGMENIHASGLNEMHELLSSQVKGFHVFQWDEKILREQDQRRIQDRELELQLCQDKECIQNVYLESSQIATIDQLIENLKHYSYYHRALREALFEKSQMRYSSWFEKSIEFIQRADASFYFYRRYVEQLMQNDASIFSQSFSNFIKTENKFLESQGFLSHLKRKSIINMEPQNLAEDFILHILCGKKNGEILDIVGIDRNFNPPRLIKGELDFCRPFFAMPSKVISQKLDLPVFSLIYSNPNNIFSIYSNGKSRAYKNIHQLIKDNLDPRFVKCKDSSCQTKQSLFVEWWESYMQPRIQKLSGESQSHYQKLKTALIQPALTKNSKIIFSKKAISKSFDRGMPILEFVKRELQFYLDTILRPIYYKYCRGSECSTEFQNWSEEVLNIAEYLSSPVTQSTSMLEEQKRRLILKIIYFSIIAQPQNAKTIKETEVLLGKGLSVFRSQPSDFELRAIEQVLRNMMSLLPDLIMYKTFITQQ